VGLVVAVGPTHLAYFQLPLWVQVKQLLSVPVAPVTALVTLAAQAVFHQYLRLVGVVVPTLALLQATAVAVVV
jgi:hypothetical protein